MDDTGAEPVENSHAAFLVWSADGEQSTARTAEITGYPQRTIQYWMRRDDWRGQWLAHGAADAERAAHQGKQMLRAATPLIVRRLLAMIGAQEPRRNALTGELLTDEAGRPIMQWSSSDRDAANAIKTAILYCLGTPLSATDVLDGSILNATYSVPNETLMPPREPGTETTAQLRARATAMLEATAQSVNTRVTSTAQRRRRV